MRKGLGSIGMVSIVASTAFLLVANLFDQRLSWPTAFVLWLLALLMLGFVGDTVYNHYLPQAKTQAKRVKLILAIFLMVFLSTYVFSRIVFHLA